MRIDAHSHVLPREYIDAIPEPGGNLPKPPIVTIEQLEAMMERYAIDRAIVSVGPPGLFFGDQAQANELARLVNETMAAIRGRDPDRFATLGMVPLPDVDAAVAELGAPARHAVASTASSSPPTSAGTYLGADALEPLYAELDRRGAYVFVHPTIPANGVALAHPGVAVRVPVRHRPGAGQPDLQRHAGALPQHPLAGRPPRRSSALPRPPPRPR